MGVDHVDRRLGVVRLADDGEPRPQLGAQTGAHDGVVVGQDDADRVRAHRLHSRTSVPMSGALTISTRPPTSAMRRRIDIARP